MSHALRVAPQGRRCERFACPTRRASPRGRSSRLFLCPVLASIVFRLRGILVQTFRPGCLSATTRTAVLSTSPICWCMAFSACCAVRATWRAAGLASREVGVAWCRQHAIRHCEQAAEFGYPRRLAEVRGGKGFVMPHGAVSRALQSRTS